VTHIFKSVSSYLPRGGTLPTEEWDRRHRVLVGTLWLNALVLGLYGIAAGRYEGVHELVHAAPLVTLAGLANSSRLSRQLRGVFASVGLLTAAALLVHLTGGLIEAHFYFFVLVVALTVYEDWSPFLAAVAYVLLHHGIVGTLDPHEVYNRPEAWANPWFWAGVHALFVAFAGVAGLIAWRLNENVRDGMRQTNEVVERLSETDSLTGLANRRKAMVDLELLFEKEPAPAVLVLFDLDGFKAYNDSFGHPAGDALLRRVGQRLASAVAPYGSAYRLGGDEFCVLARGDGPERVILEALGSEALSEQGEAFSVTASHGSCLIPSEAGSREKAMHLADERMYESKHTSRPSALSQSRDVLLAALDERYPDLSGHVSKVGELVELIGRSLGMPEGALGALRSAAELHDIGKVAIPDAIVGKPGPLDQEEWDFVRRHTVIGQRIVTAAPVLKGVGELIRHSHEAWNGSGYPDGLAGEAIPLGARVIAVCDSYDAMTSDRPYRPRMSPAAALEELRRCAGTQFDPEVVGAFEVLMRDLASERRTLLAGATDHARAH
jgi:diguanylate cyclase (GGDEF)-like protein